MSVQLLDKTRKINKLLHNNHSHKVVFNDICEVLSDILESNILVISKKGKVLGVAIHEGVDEIEELIKDQVGGFVDRMLNERLLSVLSTKENVNLATLGFAEENVKKYQAIITPIDISGERLGTLFIYKSDAQYDIDDIILSEYGTTVVGLEMMRSVNEENAEETRKIQIVKSAISTLSFSELEAITERIAPQDFLKTLADNISTGGSIFFREAFYEFISRQSEPKIQSAVLLMGRLAQREDKNLKRFHAILANPLLRKDLFGF